MHTGIQLIAPEGFDVLFKGKVYHLLRNHAESGRAFLVEFALVETVTKAKKKKGRRREYKAFLNILPRERFEYALANKLIIPAPTQSKLPPWLAALEGISLGAMDEKRIHPKTSHQSRVDHRTAIIAPAYARLDDILSARNPDNEIARYARHAGQNENRFKLWFYTKACFGGDSWLLAPAFPNCGRYKRQFNADFRKAGRPSLVGGAHHGYRATPDMIQKIEEGYDKYAVIGRPMIRIYSICMVKVFGCQVRTSVTANGKKTKHYYHPEGKPFPRRNQFRYYVLRKFGVEEVAKRKLGDARYRNQVAASEGNYSEHIANLLEVVEADGYTADEHPRGVVENCTLPRLYVIRARCGGSGKLVGIGFSLGSETETAYRMMLFCMAVPKPYFCKLFGIPYKPGDWTGEGLPAFYITDRGPGATRPTLEEFQRLIPLHELTESYAGKSKATIESSNPRETRPEGEPTYKQSPMNTIQLVRAEARRLMRDNEYINVSKRLTPEMDAARVVPNPNGVWDFLEQRGRTMAYTIPLEDAVRLFLTPIDVVIKDDGVWLEHQCYRSDALQATGALQRVKKQGHTTARAYVLDLCIRYLFVEIDGKIIEVAGKLPMSDDEEQLFVSLVERKILAQNRNATVSEFGQGRLAADSEFVADTEAMVGHLPDDGRRKKGRAPTRSEAARRETRELAKVTSKRRKIA